MSGSHLCIPRNETVQPRYFQNRIIMFFLPIPTLIYCICEIFIYSQDRLTYFDAAKYVDRSWEYINRSQTHECRNWDWGHAIPFPGTHKSELPTVNESNSHLRPGTEDFQLLVRMSIGGFEKASRNVFLIFSKYCVNQHRWYKKYLLDF